MNNANPQRKLCRGFTLVEIVVTSVIFSIIAVGVGGSFFSGMKLWNRAKQTGFYYNEVILNLEKIYRDFRECVYIPQIGFSGKAREISLPVMRNNSIFKVTYKFDPERKMLIRREVSLKDIISGKEEEGASEKAVMSLDDFSLSYFYMENGKYVWKDKWEIPGLCNALKLKVKFKNEYAEKTIFIPAI